MKRISIFGFVTLLFFSLKSYPLDIGGKGNKDGIVALYLFDETTGPVLDVSGVSPALDLTIDNPLAVDRETGSITLREPTLIHSSGPASKINSLCKTSGEVTIEVWLENRVEDPPRTEDVRIVTLSNRASDRNFSLGQYYDDTGKYRAGIRRNGSMRGDLLETTNNVLLVQALQHIIFTRDRSGKMRLFVSGSSQEDILRETLLGPVFTNPFNNWDDNASLGIGNSISYEDPSAPIDRDSGFSTEQRGWLGKIYLLAIYCKALSIEDVLGGAAPGESKFSIVQPQIEGEITAERKYASLIYKRINGVKTAIDDPVLVAMEEEIKNDNLLAAAHLATSQKGFLNITVRDFASRMSTRDETVDATLNDFVATVIGVTRDRINAKQLLTGNFSYKADPALAAVVNDPINDLLLSNNHYEGLENGNFDLERVLVKKNGQELFDGQGSTVPHPDPAGLLTSRAFMAAHALDGTNRRLVEFAFRQFLCVSIEQWADSSGPDNRIGRDIDRFPGGDHDKFTTSCKSCHSNMDGFRGAFARFSFSAGYVKNALILPDGRGDDVEPWTMRQSPIGIAYKMNKNSDVFPGGYKTVDDTWENNATRGLNASYFGWTTPNRGRGIKEFGELIANSKAFPKCMAKRVYRSVCKRDVETFDHVMIDRVSSEFESNDYDLRKLFESIVITPECLGTME